MDRDETSIGGSRGSFLTTRWSLLRRGDAAELLRIYWRPAYLYLRRKGYGVEDAKDLTQGFFAMFLERDYAAQAEPERGRFRNFLRAALDHFAADERDRTRAQKRGGGKVMPLDVEAAERLLATDETPERQFDRQWAMAVLDDAIRELEGEYRERGQSEKFAEIRPFLAGGSCEDRSALHRARRRFGELVRRRVAQTVESPAQIDEELAALFESLRRTPGKSSPEGR